MRENNACIIVESFFCLFVFYAHEQQAHSLPTEDISQEDSWAGSLLEWKAEDHDSDLIDGIQLSARPAQS